MGVGWPRLGTPSVDMAVPILAVLLPALVVVAAAGRHEPAPFVYPSVIAEHGAGTIGGRDLETRRGAAGQRGNSSVKSNLGAVTFQAEV